MIENYSEIGYGHKSFGFGFEHWILRFRFIIKYSQQIWFNQGFEGV